MHTSDFSRANLDTLVRQGDAFYYNVLKEQHLRKYYLLCLEKKLTEGSFDFAKFRQTKIGKFFAFRPTKLGDELILRRLNDIIRRVYKLKQADRNSVICQTRVLLAESVQKHVIKLDISSFYESIDRDAILQRIDSDGLVSQKAVRLLGKFFKRVSMHVPSGLPRGIGLSATLAELCFRPIDEAVRRIKGVYYYARYVDDIIIFASSDPTNIRHKIEALLPSGMKLNLKKSRSYYVGCSCADKCVHAPAQCKCLHKCQCAPHKPDLELDYLGYVMRFSNIPLASIKGAQPIEVEISDRKMARIKTRIVKSLLDHTKKNDFALLKMRLRFLTENHRIYGPSTRGKLKSGIYFSYPLLSKNDGLLDLDKFLRAQVFATSGTYGAKFAASLTTDERRELASLSFKSGYQSRRSRRLAPALLRSIRKCWSNE